MIRLNCINKEEKNNEKVKQERFYLIELLAVVVILAILVTIFSSCSSKIFRNSIKRETYATNALRTIDDKK